MKKQTLFIITLLGLALNTYSQQKPTEFETKFNDFRYSLYETLDTLTFQLSDIERVYRYIQPEIEEFINKHKKEIQGYKLNTLKLYTDLPVPDLDGYKLISDKEELDEINSSLLEVKKMKSISIYDFNTINMQTLIAMNISIFNARLGAGDMAMENIKDSFAAYRIITRQKDKDNWQIYVDKYKNIFEFTFSFKDNFLYFENVYQRNM